MQLGPQPHWPIIAALPFRRQQQRLVQQPQRPAQHHRVARIVQGCSHRQATTRQTGRQAGMGACAVDRQEQELAGALRDGREELCMYVLRMVVAVGKWVLSVPAKG